MRQPRFTVSSVLAALAIACGGGSSGPTTFTISGTVHGPTLAGVTVTLSGAGSATTTTDAAGAYQFTGLPNGSYTVTPSLAGGYVFAPASLTVVVNGTNMIGQDFAESGSYAISGTVSGPIRAGVHLALAGVVSGTTTTDSLGAYQFTGLPNGGYTVTPSVAGGYVFTPASLSVTVSGADVTGQNFGDAGAFVISGAISGPVLEGVTMTLSGSETTTVTTDAAGAYEFIAIPDGDYFVTPSFDGGWAFTPASRHVVVSGASESGQDFTVAGAFEISGTITGPAIAGVTLTLSDGGSGTTTTDAGGAYHFSGLPNANYVVTPSLAGGYVFTPASRSVAVNGADRTGQDFTEAGAFAISGTVTGPAPGGVTVTLAGHASGTTTTDAGGAYSFTGLANGGYTVTPSLAGGYAFTPSSKSVTVSGGDMTGQDFTETGAWTISGAVSGVVTSGVTMTLGGTASGTTTTGTGGTYAFTGLTDGNYSVTPSEALIVFTPPSTSLTLSGASSAGVNFSSAFQTFTISGTISGTVATGVTVRLSGAATATVTSGVGGGYSFSGLLPGSYTVTPSVAGSSFAPPSTDVTVVAADVTGRDFTASPFGNPAITLTGQVAYPGSVVGPVYVMVTGPTPGGGAGLAALATPWPSDRPFSVRGVQLFGQFGTTGVDVTAFIDAIGNGTYNSAADPAATVHVTPGATPFDVGTLTLAEPSAPVPPAAPTIQGVIPADGAVAVLFQGPQANGGEAADSYRIYWDTVAPVDPSTASGPVLVKAGPSFGIVHGLTDGTPYYFAVEAWAGTSHSTAAQAGPSVPDVPSGANTISGTVSYPTPDVTPSALYVVATVANGGGYVQRIPDATGTSYAFSIDLPDGTYSMIAFIDLGDDGYVGPTEPGFFNNGAIGSAVTVGGGQILSGLALAIPTGDAAARLATVNFLSPSTDFRIQYGVDSGAKIPLAASLTGPNLPGPVDLGLTSNGGGNRISLASSFDLFPAVPLVGDAYTLSVTFVDGTTATFPLPVTAVPASAPTMTSPAPNETGVSLTPVFTWDPPVPAPAGTWFYVINVFPNGGGNGWSYVMPNTQVSVVYNVDGSGPALLPGTQYGWQLAVADNLGNFVLGQQSFTTAP